MKKLGAKDLIFWSSCSIASVTAFLCLSFYLNHTYIRHLSDAWSPEVIVSINSGKLNVLGQMLLGASWLAMFFTIGTLVIVVLVNRKDRNN